MRTVGDSLELFHDPADLPVSVPARPVFRVPGRILNYLEKRIHGVFSGTVMVDALLFLAAFLLAGWICFCLHEPLTRQEAPAPQCAVHTVSMPSLVHPLQGY